MVEAYVFGVMCGGVFTCLAMRLYQASESLTYTVYTVDSAKEATERWAAERFKARQEKRHEGPVNRLRERGLL